MVFRLCPTPSPTPGSEGSFWPVEPEPVVLPCFQRPGMQAPYSNTELPPGLSPSLCACGAELLGGPHDSSRTTPAQVGQEIGALSGRSANVQSPFGARRGSRPRKGTAVSLGPGLTGPTEAPLVTHVPLESAHGDPSGRAGAGQAHKVPTANVTGEEGGSNLQEGGTSGLGCSGTARKGRVAG